ncbi:MAG: hypothetical protein ACD_72C00077G0003 [uncultured bacterium]|nr:MAG: hypothetical protein ACD_72C00077G0003 [uncultured bacterium]
MIYTRVKYFIEKLIAKGTVVECACCDKMSRRFFPAGVVNKRPFARCAFCGSLERHRLIALMLKEYPLSKEAQILCIAPEEPLTQFLKKSFTAKITTLDLLRKDVDFQADVCALPFDNASYDVIIANHVLEHVADDQAAMREIRRVLKPNGQIILQTPIHWDIEKTDEDPTASPAECLRRFGQDDHVRLYGRDFEQRLRNIDWNVDLIPVVSHFSPDEINKYGLESDEIFFRITINK